MEKKDLEKIFVSINDAAAAINCGRSMVYELVKTKQLPLVKIGRRSVVPIAALLAFAADKTNEVA